MKKGKQIDRCLLILGLSLSFLLLILNSLGELNIKTSIKIVSIILIAFGMYLLRHDIKNG